MLVGPFDSYTKIDDNKVEVRKTVYRSIGLGKYSANTIKIVVDKDEVVEKEDGVYIDVDSPSDIMINTVGGKRVVYPRINPDSVETVIPVKITGRDKNKVRFYGYYVTLTPNGVVDVKGAGIYERYIGSERTTVGFNSLPAVLVKDITELDKNEFSRLARNTPISILRILDSKGADDIVLAHLVEVIKDDPLQLAEYPPNLLKRYFENNKNTILRAALTSTTPEMIEILIEEIKAKGGDSVEVANLIQTLYNEEEKKKDEEEKKKHEEEEKKRREEEERRKQEEEQKKQNFRATMSTLGVVLPLVAVIPPLTLSLIKVSDKVSKKASKSEKVVEETESASAS